MPDYVDDYGGDLQDPSQRCRHGTFIGSWSGPDYMCGWCESGEEPEPPTPTVQCEGYHVYTDYDGTAASAECLTDAVHRVVFREHWNPDYPHEPYDHTVAYCQEHLLQVFDHFRENLRVGSEEFVRLELGPGEPEPWHFKVTP